MSLFHYHGEVSRILIYEIISKTVYGVILEAYQWLTGLLLWNLGRPAFTSGDIPYILRSWQGWILVLAGFLSLVLYTVFDINMAILIGDRLIHQKPLKFRQLLIESFAKMKHFMNVRGVLVIAYVSLIVPLLGAAFHISLFGDFSIPEFIMAIINDDIRLRILYYVALVIMLALGFIYVFTFHYVLLGDKSVPRAMRESRRTIRHNWKHFVKEYVLFLLRAAAIIVPTLLLVYVIPINLMKILPISRLVHRVGIIFFTLLFVGSLYLIYLLFIYYNVMKLNVLYEGYTEEDEGPFVKPPQKRHRGLIAVSVLGVLAVLAASIYAAPRFSEEFPLPEDVKVVAHRGGGTLANENTLLGLEAAIEWNASYSEIDVQRTFDGYYIINHDATFERCCGDSRTPGEMTLQEIKDELEVVNAANPFEPTTQVATLEEMLDAAKGRIGLYIELKGESADRDMVADVYDMVAERDMLDEVMFIGMNYSLINYFETEYPDANTGYLCYFSFGRIDRMNCDALLMESQTATEENVEKVHKAGKEAIVWTINTLSSMTHFFDTKVDAVITDEVAQADIVKTLLVNRSDEARVLYHLLS